MFVRKTVAILFLAAQAGIAAADGVQKYPNPGDFAQLTDTSMPQPFPQSGDYAQLTGTTGTTRPYPESGEYAQ